MIRTATPTADLALRGTGNALARERTSVTAPSYRSAHGTGLPFAGAAGMTATVAVPGSPPRAAPV